jgi:hypothetical protein
MYQPGYCVVKRKRSVTGYYTPASGDIREEWSRIRAKTAGSLLDINMNTFCAYMTLYMPVIWGLHILLQLHVSSANNV